MNIKFAIYENVILILFLIKCDIYLLIHGFYYLIFKIIFVVHFFKNLSQLIVKSKIYIYFFTFFKKLKQFTHEKS